MIYLIGGPPRCGKTTVAKRLAERLCCSRLPVDYLTTAFMGYVLPADEARMFPREGVRGDERFARFSAGQIVRNYRTKAEHTRPGLRSVIEYAASDGHTMVLEGYQIEPRFVDALRRDIPDLPVRAVFLVRNDAVTLEADLQRGEAANDWLIRETKEAATFARVAQMIVTYSAIIVGEAQRYGLPLVDTGHPFFERIEAAVDVLCNPA
jgi:2-phosphoglycerate kinase